MSDGPRPDVPHYRDRLAAPVLIEGERVVARFAPSRAAYIRNHLVWAAAGGVISVAALLVMGRSHLIWAAVLGVIGALGLRGIVLYRDVMRSGWVLTADTLIGPGNERIALTSVAQVRAVLGDVLVATTSGRKLLIRYLDDPAKAVRLIEAQR